MNAVKRKLVLGSGGIFFEHESDPILDHIFSLTEKKTDRKMVYLPTGGHDSNDMEETVRDYCLRHGFREAVSLYLTDETLTPEYIRDTILSADVIYARGGNLMFLLDTWRKTGADVWLKQAYNQGIVIAGQSSGAMCWCRRGYDNCGEGGSFMFLDGLDLIPYVLCPHFEDWPSFLEDVKSQDLDAFGLDNDIVISIVDGEYTIVDSGRNPLHSAFWMPKDENFAVTDLVVNHLKIENL